MKSAAPAQYPVSGDPNWACPPWVWHRAMRHLPVVELASGRPCGDVPPWATSRARPAWCIRTEGHGGRHHSTILRGGVHRVWAVWS